MTDANLVLGRIGAQIGLGVEAAAMATLRIANNNTVGALHTALTEQGLDPRDFTLMPFGGAGPLHVSDLMTDASIPRGLMPNFPGQFSTLGFTLADARVDRHRTVQLSSRGFDAGRAGAAMSALLQECLVVAPGKRLAVDAYGNLRITAV